MDSFSAQHTHKKYNANGDSSFHTSAEKKFRKINSGELLQSGIILLLILTITVVVGVGGGGGVV